MKVSEVGAITHLLSEDIGDIALSADVKDGDCTISNPFPCGVLFIFNVTITLSRHVVTPFDASIIVIVEGGRRCTVSDGETEVGQAGNHVSGVDSEARAHVGSPNLGLA